MDRCDRGGALVIVLDIVASETTEKLKTSCGGRFMVLAPWRSRLFGDGVFLPRALVAASQELKRSKSRHIAWVTLARGEQVVVKRYLLRPGVEGKLQRLWPFSAAEDEWRHGRALVRAGILTAAPLAVGFEPATKDAPASTILVMRALEDVVDIATLRAQGRLPGRTRRECARRLGHLMRRMHDAGVFHLDPHLGNFLVRQRKDRLEVAPLDLRRAHVQRAPSDAARRSHLVLLYQNMGAHGTRADRLRFLHGYLGEVGRETIAMWAHALEQRSRPALQRFVRRRSRAALRENRRFTLRRVGNLRWHLRRELVEPKLEALLEDPEQAFINPGRVLKQGRSSQVVLSGEWVIKRIFPKRWRTRILERIRPARTLRALRAAFLLEMNGIRTPRVAAAGTRVARGVVERGYLITESVCGAIHLDAAVRDAAPLERSKLLAEAAVLIRRLHRTGLTHRDLKASNILVDQSAALHLVDLDGLRMRASVPPRRAIRDLERLLRDLRARAALTPLEEESMTACVHGT